MKKLKIIAFVAILLSGIVLINDIFHTKMVTSMEVLYDLPDDTVDVLIVGSSHSTRDVNPAILYEQKGYAAYALGSPSQPIWLSYYYLKEALKTQSPRVVMVDCYRISLPDDYYTGSVSKKAVGAMRHSVNRLLAILSAFPEGYSDYLSVIVGIPLYHSRYGELTKKDFTTAYDDLSACTLGFSPLWSSEEGEHDEAVNDITERKAIGSKSMLYLEQIIELCESKGIQLVLINAPMSTKETVRQPYYNYLADYSKEQGIPFINGVLLFDELELNNETDWGRGSHLSYLGAEKWSSYLTNYLAANYDLPDRRGDEVYSRWKENASLLREMELQKLGKEDDPDDFE